ncbi:ent-kaurene synthase [Aspergillus ellipticus CBS 707.79]|uniref:Ent-kaurene synthase n=1 Tax=Aspergillus ellipticus CBS 707.79 TaxID=1448320 RepID=A0A319D233_9EURO|nr:ent-kaurene synthase [Aspergillus ellipticus CBS 707.79]
MELNERKLAKFRPEMVTSKRQTTLLHSLEGLIGKVDFNQLSHHCTIYGGMLGSPASTAAYLIHSAQWDDSAEQYLRNVIKSYGSCGGVPSGFPSPVFEASWTISTLLASEYSMDDFTGNAIEEIRNYLDQLLEEQKGLLGFAPGFVPDADDTSRALLAQGYLGTQGDPSSLVQYFEATDHFQTYQLERDPSFSANANILLALLIAPDPGAYSQQIEKAVKFMLSRWEDGALRDKWNLAAEYSEMLLGSGLCRLIEVRSQGRLSKISTELIDGRVPIALGQLLSRMVTRQFDNGSWQSSIERTAYSVLLLADLLKLPWPRLIRDLAHTALLKGREYLTLHADDWSEGDYIWIEKVTYKLPILAETYALAAMRAPAEEKMWTTDVVNIFAVPEKKLQRMSMFFGRLPLFANVSPTAMLLAVAEAQLYSQSLRAVRLDIFPRDEMAMTEDKYLDYIPIAWTSVNTASGLTLSGKAMWDMMVISMLNYQADEYMESVVATLSTSSIAQLKTVIRTECLDGLSASRCSSLSHETETSSLTLQLTPPLDDSDSQTPTASIQEVVEILKKYVQHIRHHRGVVATPESAQKQVAEELEKFLLAHMAHNADNARMRTQSGNLPDQSYFDWVRTTGANDTSCPYSFAFFCCLIGERDSEFSSAKQRYFTRALGLHLATMCRQYNDYGSHRRDIAEGNLNSLDFEEFQSDDAKEDLMAVAEFERECMKVCFARLSAEINAATVARIQAFIDVTDLFGQIYVAQDIASRIQK